MNSSGQYYLHSNGSLIYKPHGGVERDAHLGGFVVEVWKVDTVKYCPDTFLVFLSQAKHFGAKESEIERLAAQNKLSEYFPDWRNRLAKGE